MAFSATVDSSAESGFGGLLLLISIVLFSRFLYVTTNKNFSSDGNNINQEYSPEGAQQQVTLAHITGMYSQTYFPREFWPSKIPPPSVVKRGRSPIYKLAWAVIVSWLYCASLYMIFASMLLSIENQRPTETLHACILTCLVLLLCALWRIVIKIGSLSPKQLQERMYQEEQVLSGDASFKIHDLEPTKQLFIATAAFILVISFFASFVAMQTLEPLTLSRHQIGLGLFFGFGLSVLSGWLFVAMMLGIGTSVASYSSLYGSRQPESDNQDRRNRFPPSWVPLFWSILLFVFALVSKNPYFVLPFFITFLFFVPRHFPNIVSLIVSFVALILAAVI
jgi:hypothetical protein